MPENYLNERGIYKMKIGVSESDGQMGIYYIELWFIFYLYDWYKLSEAAIFIYDGLIFLHWLNIQLFKYPFIPLPID